MIRLLIADDHAVVRQGLKQILSDSSDIAVEGEAANGQELLEKVRTAKWDLIVLDISMPGQSGVDILKQLRSEQPKLPVLVLSMHSEDQFAERVLKAGASGYLTKESAPEELILAIRKILSGGKYLSPALAERLAFSRHTADRGPLHASLSDREYEILCKIASGKTVSQISNELFLSVKTISTYRARVLEKMGMKTNAELTGYALRHQLVG
jgi:two-component system, NarL family, invasion response regulator UvrY